MQYSTDNKFVQRLKELQESAAVEKIPLIPTTPEEMSEMLQLCSYVALQGAPAGTVASTAAKCLPLPCSGGQGQLPRHVPSLSSAFIHSASAMPVMYPAL